MPRRSIARWLVPAIIALAWLGLAGPLGALGGQLSTVQENDSAAFLPDSAESTRVTELLEGFRTSRALPVILLWEGSGEGDGGTLDPQQLADIGQRVDEAVSVVEDADALEGQASPPISSEDGVAAQAFLPINPDLGDRLPDLIAELRGLDAVDGTTFHVTGPGATFSDFASGFSGIDGLLLLAAFGVVLLILLVVYRSPLLPLLVIGTAGLALSASTAVAYLLAEQGVIAVNGQSQGIASILVVGAATDYGDFAPQHRYTLPPVGSDDDGAAIYALDIRPPLSGLASRSSPASTGTGGRAGRLRAAQATASASTSRSTRNFTGHRLQPLESSSSRIPRSAHP